MTTMRQHDFAFTDSDFHWSVVSGDDIAHAESVTECAHGLADTAECQPCWIAGIFHRQVLRMAEWLSEQKGLDWTPADAREIADDRTREHCGFLPKIGPCPPERQLPKLPPVNISKYGLVAVPAPIEGNVAEIAFHIQRADGLALNDLQRAIGRAIAGGAAWVAA